ncbi:MAG TPA: alpha/beta fold hydrolase [Streptosporangiaceae bacterium]|nr:alpha/beta fold hydrolase [Streptosporangiaceae bacterium]
MPWFDLSVEELAEYRIATQEPPGLDAWWADRLAAARAAARPPKLTPHEPALYAPLEVHDVEFSGADGDRIRAWYIRPSFDRDDAAPVVVKFIGYGGGRDLPTSHLTLPALGYALFVMDTRGQGGRWSTGATEPANSTVLTQGITRPEDYYYTKLFTDAVRAVETAAVLADGAVAVSGGSQGGALALAAAALAPDLVRLCHADVPFLCDIQRAITLAPSAPYTEVPEFLAQNTALIPAALDTLRYVDCALLARRITASSLLSTALMDTICPPSTVFAAYHEITAEKEIVVHPYSGHDVPATHVERQLRHLREFWPV